MKPLLEKINPGFGNSFTLRSFVQSPEKEGPHWHFHPEFEIVYISNGKGKRHIANHISYYKEGDLIVFPKYDLTNFLRNINTQNDLDTKYKLPGKDYFDYVINNWKRMHPDDLVNFLQYVICKYNLVNET
jgi:hypothetical protein